MDGFLRYELRGLIHGGAYFLNFTETKWNPINGLGMADTITIKTKRFTWFYMKCLCLGKSIKFKTQSFQPYR